MTRIGVVLPSVNTVVEPWFNRVAPARVSVHAARMLLADSLSAQALVRMDEEDGVRALQQMASCRPAAVAYCCTASSVMAGAPHDARMVSQIRSLCGVPGTTATAALLDALATLRCRRVVAVSPYPEEFDAAERHFFRSAGLDVMAGQGMGISDAFSLAGPEPAQIKAFVLSQWQKEAQAVVITCLNLRSHAVIELLERELGVPVVTATQAVLWRLLRLAGVNEAVAGYGRLLREH